MRPALLPSLFSVLTLLTSCAYEGVVVQKTTRAHPFYLSHGIEGKRSFVLRDRSGAPRRQMVTPDVYDAYAEGDYFNDQQPRASGDGKAVVERRRVTTRARANNGVRVAARSRSSRHASATSRSDSKEVVTTADNPPPQFVFVTDSSPARPILLDEPEIGVVFLARVR